MLNDLLARQLQVEQEFDLATRRLEEEEARSEDLAKEISRLVARISYATARMKELVG